MTTSDDSTTNPPLKRCGKGSDCIHPLGCWQPATSEFFGIHQKMKGGLQSWCRDCKREAERKRRVESPDKTRGSQRRYRATHPQKCVDSRRQYYRKHTTRIRASAKKWRAENPDKWRAQMQKDGRKYATLKRGLVATFTNKEWQSCLNYWHGVCAYCGAQQSFWNVLEQDHFIALTAGGGYTADNIVPACRSCNASKNYKAAIEWIDWKFKRKAKAIIARIEKYFEWVKSQPKDKQQ